MLISLTEKLIDGYFALIPRPSPHSEAVSQAKLIAHRGAHQQATGIIENTIPAFDLARELGCWGIEFDIHATADNVLVVNHDPDLQRLWGKAVAIADLSFNQLRSLEPRIPTLEEVLERYGQIMHLFIELKTPFRDEAVLEQALKGLIPCRDYHILSLDAPLFTALTKFPNQSLMLVPVHNNVKKFCDISLKEQYGGVLGSYLLLTNALIDRLKAARQMTGVGFVNSRYSLYRELNRGVSWIFTNNAAEVSHYLQDLRQ